ncbi:MAG: hypothetical protein N2258_06690 [Brevinematales bacterium]|nr:hypothetical protein [Brevinematales bacterium]
MKDKNLFLILLVLIVGSCGEGKVKEEELKIVETKVISESEPYTKPDKSIVIKNTDMALREETVRIYNSYNITNKIEELSDGNRATVWISRNSSLDDYLVFPVYGLEAPNVRRKDILPYAMDILSGWAKNKKSFKVYNRPKRIRLEFYEVPFYRPNSQYEETYLIEERFRLVYVLIVELTDELAWHRLNIGMKPIEGYYKNPPLGGRLVIEDVYPGISNFTAISEIRFVYRETNETNKK